MLQQVRQGNRAALEPLLLMHRDYLRRVIDLRLDARLRARIDASDVVQEAFLEAVRRMPDYLARAPMPFHLWLRQTAQQRLIDLSREQGGAIQRAPRVRGEARGARQGHVADAVWNGGSIGRQEFRDMKWIAAGDGVDVASRVAGPGCKGVYGRGRQGLPMRSQHPP